MDHYDHDLLEDALPSAILRKEIEGLANGFSGLSQTATNAMDNRKERERDLAVLTKELGGLPDKQLPADIATSLKTARELGNTEVTKAEIKERIRRAADTYDIHVAKLSPWTGSAEEIRKLAVPSDSEVQEFKNSERDLIVELKAAKEHREAISRFFEMGLSVPEVALISGHKDYRMLARYTHLRADDVVGKLRYREELRGD